MPTENRSSNTEMVSVPRDKLQAWQERFSKAQIFRESSEVQALLAQPAEQHQGEPVAMPERLDAPYPHAGYPGGWNACLDEIAKLGPLYTRPEPAVQQEPVARLRCYQSAIGPKVEVIEFTEQAFKPGRELDVYTRADPGEVEQLSRIIRDLNDERDEIGAEAGRLRAQLAERDALLREGVASCYEAAQMAEQIERAEPIRVSTTLLAPARPFKISDAKGKAGVLKARLIEVAEALSASAEPSAPADEVGFDLEAMKAAIQGPMTRMPDGISREELREHMKASAPVERDERADFEEDFKNRYPHVFHDIELGRSSDGLYLLNPAMGEWSGWQARAALERKP